MKTYAEIPTNRPDTPLLDTINVPADLKPLTEAQLRQLADELRHFLLWSVGQSGGHLGASLGVVELTVALHSILNLPSDQLIWDVGHQCYPHKILTERKDRMGNIRKKNGLKGFPSRNESSYDSFGTGHSSTSVSAGLGMAVADDLLGHNNRHVVVIGDGAATAGMAFEALSHGGFLNKDILVILNDNSMSISPNIGGLSKYLARLWAMPFYFKVRENGRRTLGYRTKASRFVERLEFSFKSLFTPGGFFQDLGWHYVGPLDGHDVKTVTRTVKHMLELPGPNLLHLVTRKGAGLEKAEADPLRHHSISGIYNKHDAKHMEDLSQDSTNTSVEKIEIIPKKPLLKYQDVFGDWLCTRGAEHSSLIGITPAMREGSGMVDFAKQFPTRFFDVAIAEQHAVTFAAGMATKGLKPIVAIYSTFLQRAYDQLIHDVAIQQLDVTFAVDRAGLVGEDGPTHMGAFDIGFTRLLPNVVITAPSDEAEVHKLLDFCWQYPGTAIVRYPRGEVAQLSVVQSGEDVEMGKARLLHQGQKPVVIFAFGHCVEACCKVAIATDVTLYDMRFIKPLDEATIIAAIAAAKLAICVEEGAKIGGIGQEINRLVHSNNALCKFLHFGIEDEWVEQASRAQQFKQQHLHNIDIQKQINKFLKSI